ncbi:MAG TPA: DNA-formamidopyrimidine glycosylase family protein [Thermomicrobiales bacterium]|nr:DNA-formamidopyrimidine glycosylase family protein [Thermomicrobiales bacterium]
MPELPEVETMRRIVERELTGRTLASVEVRLPKLLRESPMPDLQALVGRRVLGARRRAKVLAIDWSGGLTSLAHFKLAGQLAVIHPTGERQVAGHPVPAPDGDYPHQATHVIYRFADGTTLYHSDIRQFGWLRLMPTEEADRALEAFGFAAEGVGPDMIAADALRARLARRRIPIKQALLDQTVVAGLGNIYVDEALHHAAIHPARPANGLMAAEFDRLYAAIPWALERGIAQGGAKILHGRAYPVDGFPAIHGREGEACFRCGATIVKTRVGGRGTYYCPVCQPELAVG